MNLYFIEKLVFSTQAIIISYFVNYFFKNYMWLWIKKDCLEINSVPYAVNGLTFPAINLVIYTIILSQAGRFKTQDCLVAICCVEVQLIKICRDFLGVMQGLDGARPLTHDWEPMFLCKIGRYKRQRASIIW